MKNRINNCVRDSLSFPVASCRLEKSALEPMKSKRIYKCIAPQRGPCIFRQITSDLVRSPSIAEMRSLAEESKFAHFVALSSQVRGVKCANGTIATESSSFVPAFLSTTILVSVANDGFFPSSLFSLCHSFVESCHRSLCIVYVPQLNCLMWLLDFFRSADREQNAQSIKGSWRQKKRTIRSNNPYFDGLNELSKFKRKKIKIWLVVDLR